MRPCTSVTQALLLLEEGRVLAARVDTLTTFFTLMPSGMIRMTSARLSVPLTRADFASRFATTLFTLVESPATADDDREPVEDRYRQ